MRASLSPACSPRQPATKRPLGDSRETIDEVCIDTMGVEITDPMEYLEDPSCKKSSRTCPSDFAPTNTSIANLLAGITEYHSTVGGITVQDEL